MIIISDITYNELRKGDSVIFARVLPRIGYYELLDLYIVSVYNKYCTGADTKTKQTYCFGRKWAEDVLFLNRNLAIEYLNKKKQENKNVKVAEE